MEKEQLKLVVLFNAAQNQYTTLAHNLSPEQALEVVKQNTDGGTPMILDQRSRHKNDNAGDCRTCREIVGRKSNLQPKPKFVRTLPAPEAMTT